jgi:hypothetical protein
MKIMGVSTSNGLEGLYEGKNYSGKGTAVEQAAQAKSNTLTDPSTGDGAGYIEGHWWAYYGCI